MGTQNGRLRGEVVCCPIVDNISWVFYIVINVLFITHELVAKTWTRLVYNMTRIKMEKIFYDEERKT